MTRQEAQQKKEYTLDDIIRELDDAKGIDRIYYQYFSLNKCTQLFNILNKFSRVDAILTSGGTNILIEYKNRSDTSITKYDSTMFELQKHKKLSEASQIFAAPCAYVVEWKECILVYMISENEYQYKWETIPAPTYYGSKTIVDKSVTMLPHTSADIIIAKRNWERATAKQLSTYIERRKNEYAN